MAPRPNSQKPKSIYVSNIFNQAELKYYKLLKIWRLLKDSRICKIHKDDKSYLKIQYMKHFTINITCFLIPFTMNN